MKEFLPTTCGIICFPLAKGFFLGNETLNHKDLTNFNNTMTWEKLKNKPVFGPFLLL